MKLIICFALLGLVIGFNVHDGAEDENTERYDADEPDDNNEITMDENEANDANDDNDDEKFEEEALEDNLKLQLNDAATKKKRTGPPPPLPPPGR